MQDAEFALIGGTFLFSISLIIFGFHLAKKRHNLTAYISQKQAQLDKKPIKELVSNVKAKFDEVSAKLIAGRQIYGQLEQALDAANTEMEKINVGLEPPAFSFGDSESLKAEINGLRANQFKCIKDNRATKAFSDWTFFGSKADGYKMVADYRILLLKAFNAEFEVIRKQMRLNTFDTATTKLNRLEEQLKNLGETANVSISTEYFYMKLDELKVWHKELIAKDRIKQQRKLQQAKLREQNKFGSDNSEELDEEIAQRESELLRAQRKARVLAGEARAELELLIENIMAEKRQLEEQQRRAISQAQITRSGYIYVISNIGCFGEGVVKIGMTRRLEPMDRVVELGDASVPFRFDVHSITFVDDAPKTEKALHTKFNEFRVNTENLRKEFFRVEPKDVQKAMDAMGIDADWYFDVEAQEFNESQQIRQMITERKKPSVHVAVLPDTI